MVSLDPSKRKPPVKKVAITQSDVKKEDTIASEPPSDSKPPQQQVCVFCVHAWLRAHPQGTSPPQVDLSALVLSAQAPQCFSGSLGGS